MYTHARTAAQTIGSALRKRYPDEIVSVYAFGSRVRGDHGPGSDFDILVIVKSRSTALEEAIIGVIVEQEIKSGVSFDPVIKTEESFELEKRHSTPFYQNIQREGIQV